MPPLHDIVPLNDCADPALVGGKASGLGALLRAGFRVPSGVCLTTAVYASALRAAGLDAPQRWKQALAAQGSARDRLLADCRQAMLSAAIPPDVLRVLEQELTRMNQPRWAVRSSATDEDGAGATFAGIYRTILDVPGDHLAAAILECWASIWTSSAMAYHERMKQRRPPAMAVVFQPMLAPRAAGVAYSRHPVTGQTDLVVINAVAGLAEALVSGQALPDQCVVQTGSAPAIVERHVAEPGRALALSDQDAVTLADTVHAVERALGHPVDVEWALEQDRLWVLQARAIPHAAVLTEQNCLWSRANFRETLPDVPSPLGISFLQAFMDRAILRHYRTLGCTIPSHLSSVRIARGRPYINVSLFQHFMAQLGGGPESIADQMGGQPHPLPVEPPRLPLWKLLRAGFWMEWQIRRAARVAPQWFAEMKRMADGAAPFLERKPDPDALLAELDRLGERLYAGDLTFATVGGVSQGLAALRWLLERRLGPGWRTILNASLQGRSGAISAQQILRLVEVADLARREPAARAFFTAGSWTPEPWRAVLTGTETLRELDRYLADYGHRAVGESDVASPRFAEMPDYVLGVIRSHVQRPDTKSATAIRQEQETTRTGALRRIRAAYGRRLHEWLAFRWAHRRLARYFALREANRHALMYFSTATRKLFLAVGHAFATQGRLHADDDIFFLTSDEIRDNASGGRCDWKRLVAARRAEQQRNMACDAPDTFVGTLRQETGPDSRGSDGTWRGLPISPGRAEGPARLLRKPGDRARVQKGDILVAPVVDPGMAPLFGVAAGLVVEMGGTLSHGAIIAREYGLPAVANAAGILAGLRDGERIVVDADRGEIRRLAP